MRNTLDVMIGGLDYGQTPSVQQHDVNSRVFACRLWQDKDVPFVLPENAVVGAVFKWRRSNGGHEYETQLEGRSTVLVTVPAEAVKLDGIVEMQLAIHQEDSVLHGPVISFAALKSLTLGGSAESEPPLLLVALAKETQELLTELRQAKENGEFDGYTPQRGVDYWTEEDLAQMQAGFLPSTAGAVANANIADRAINNAKLDYDSVTNAKIRAGTIQTDRLTEEAQRQLTGGPYMQISMDGSTRVNITQGKHVFGLRLITDTARNLDTWLLNHSTWDGVYLHQGTDIEGPMLMLGRSDFIGGIHGDEHMTSVRMIADGVDVTGSTVELGNVKVFAVYVESTVYDVDSSTELFTRQKVLTFHGNRLTVENRWTYTGAAMDYVQRWPGCGLYSVYTSNALGVRTNENLMPSMQAQDWNQKITEAEFWVSGMHVTMRALRGMENADYAGSVETLDGSARIKVYLDTIHSPEGHAVSAGDVLKASYEIVINE